MRIGVYGLGRFGYFWASLLASHLSSTDSSGTGSLEATVKAYNRNPDRPTPEGVKRVSVEELAGCDTIFLCVAISAVEPVVRELSPHLEPGTTVADTCSVKRYPVDLMRRHLPDGVGILATHPMFGPDSAKHGIAGLPLIYWPERYAAVARHGAPGGLSGPGLHAEQDEKDTQDDTAGVDWWPEWFASVGLRTIRMSPDEHDHEAAYTQGITHFIGRVLDDLSVRPSPIGTVGYQKILDVVEQTCNDPLQLFLDLQRYNPYTTEMRAKLKASLERVLAQFDEQ